MTTETQILASEKRGPRFWDFDKFFEKISNVTDQAQTYLIFCVCYRPTEKLSTIFSWGEGFGLKTTETGTQTLASEKRGSRFWDLDKFFEKISNATDQYHF